MGLLGLTILARVRCPYCRHEFLVAFSCELRGLCPNCHQKRELLWAEWAEAELLEDVPHRQVVFTIPKRLRFFFRYDRKLLGELAGCAWRALGVPLHVEITCINSTAGGTRQKANPYERTRASKGDAETG